MRDTDAVGLIRFGWSLTLHALTENAAGEHVTFCGLPTSEQEGVGTWATVTCKRCLAAGTTTEGARDR